MMFEGDGTLCWRLVLIANSVTVGWAWWYRRGRLASRHWSHGVALVAWLAVLVATALQCGWLWAVAAILVSTACGSACAVLFRAVR